MGIRAQGGAAQLRSLPPPHAGEPAGIQVQVRERAFSLSIATRLAHHAGDAKGLLSTDASEITFPLPRPQEFELTFPDVLTYLPDELPEPELNGDGPHPLHKENRQYDI